MNQIEQHTACLVDLLRNYGVDPAQYLAGVVHRLDAEQAERRQKERKRSGDAMGAAAKPGEKIILNQTRTSACCSV